MHSSQTSSFRSDRFGQILGVAGSVILFLGVFAPIISAPIIGSINYFRNGTGDGEITIILAAISAILASRKEFRGLVASGVCPEHFACRTGCVLDPQAIIA